VLLVFPFVEDKRHVYKTTTNSSIFVTLCLNVTFQKQSSMQIRKKKKNLFMMSCIKIVHNYGKCDNPFVSHDHTHPLLSSSSSSWCHHTNIFGK